MSDNDLHYESDEYHEDDYHDLHRDDSLPDLVLSSSTIRDSDPDLLEPPADLGLSISILVSRSAHLFVSGTGTSG